MEQHISSDSKDTPPFLTQSRPLFFAAVAYILGILYGAEFMLDGWIFTGVAIIWLALGIIFRSRFLAFCVIAVFFAGSASICFSYNTPLEYIDISSPHSIEGRVCDISLKDEYTSIKLTEVKIDGVPFSKGIFMTTKSRYEMDDIVTSNAKLSYPSNPEYPLGFDDFKYCRANGVAFRAYSTQDSLIGRADDLIAWIGELRTSVAVKLDALLGTQAPMAKALILGIDWEIANASGWRDAGIWHLLCVSGMHVVFLTSALLAFLKLFRVGYISRLIITSLFVILFSLFAGLKLSIIRATVMYLLSCWGNAFGKRTDRLTILSAAFFVVILPDSARLFDLGLQLSFGAVFAMICFTIKIPISPRVLSDAVSSTLSASIGVTPLVLNTSNKFWLLSPVISSAAILYASVLVPFLAFVTILYCIFGNIVEFLGEPTAFLLYVLDYLSTLPEKLPSLSFNVPSTYPFWTALIFLVAFVCSRHFLPSLKIKITAISCCTVLAIASFVIPQISKPPLQVDILKNMAIISSNGETLALKSKYDPDAYIKNISIDTYLSYEEPGIYNVGDAVLTIYEESALLTFRGENIMTFDEQYSDMLNCDFMRYPTSAECVYNTYENGMISVRVDKETDVRCMYESIGIFKE